MRALRTLALAIGFALATSSAGAAEGIDARLLPRLQQLVERAESDPEGALDGLEALARQWRRDADQQRFVVRERAALLFRLERPAQARRELEAALEGLASSEALDLRYQLGQIALALEDPDSAAEQLGLWAEQSERPAPSGLILLGYAQVQRERYAEAIPPLERALAADAGAAGQSWIELLAYCYVQTGRAPDAVALFERLIAAQPARAHAWRQLASAYLMIEQIPRGTAALTIADRLGDLPPEDVRRLARLLASQGAPEAGATVLERARADERSEARAREELELAQMWLRARELDRAIEALRRAARSSGETEPVLRIAQLYLQWERPADAQAELERLVRERGESAPAEAAYLLAVAYANQGELEAAQRALEPAASLPQTRERADRLAAYLADRRRRRERRAAVEAASQALDSRPPPLGGTLGN